MSARGLFNTSLVETSQHLVDSYSSTVAGMAHFAFTGPEGTTCRQCINWGPETGRYKRDEGELCPRRCRKYPRLMRGVEGPGVPHATPSCRHFEQRATIPELHPSRGPYRKPKE